MLTILYFPKYSNNLPQKNSTDITPYLYAKLLNKNAI